jgi:hypothetical protein
LKQSSMPSKPASLHRKEPRQFNIYIPKSCFWPQDELRNSSCHISFSERFKDKFQLEHFESSIVDRICLPTYDSNAHWRDANMTRILIAVALLGSVLGQAAEAQPRQLNQQEALRLLSASRPYINWDLKSALKADIDCDRFPDEIFLGRAAGKIFVGVVRAAIQEPEILEFGVGSAAQDAICQEPAKLKIESLDYDPAGEFGPVDGFRRSRRCKGIMLSGGECDPIHLYWNYNVKHMGWWRE